MVLANFLGSDGLIVVVIALVVIFGGSQLPKIARNVGSAGKEFRKAQQEADDEAKADAAAKAAAAPPQAPPAPAVIAPTPPVVQEGGGDDSVTMSKADLEKLIDERLGKGGSAGTTN